MQHYADIAASLQAVLEARLLDLALVLKNETQEQKLCYAGGVALNCLANKALQQAGYFSDIYIPPDPGDGEPPSVVRCMLQH